MFSPGAVVADSDAVQAGESEDAQSQSDDDNVKYSELWVENNKIENHWTHSCCYVGKKIFFFVDTTCNSTVKWK